MREKRAANGSESIDNGREGEAKEDADENRRMRAKPETGTFLREELKVAKRKIVNEVDKRCRVRGRGGSSLSIGAIGPQMPTRN
jgi:hypothetical protein